MIKKLLFISLIIVWLPVSSWGGDTDGLKVTEEIEDTTPSGTDLLYMVKDPAGTPLDRKVQMTNMFDYLIPTSSILAGYLSDETGTGVAVFGTSPTLLGVIDAGGATSLEVPNGSAPTVNTVGEIAVDTNIFSDHGGLVLYDGTSQLNCAGASDTPTNGQVLTFTSGTGVNWAAAPGGGGTNDFSWTFEPQTAKLPAANPMGIDGGNLRWRGLYDDTTDECAQWSTTLRPYQAGTLQGEILVSLETTSSSDIVEMELSIMCVTPADAQDVDSDSFGATDSISSGSVSWTAGYLYQLSDASLTGDTCAEGDMIIVRICRDADDTDTTADDVELREVTIYE